ncbi:Protein CBG27880 [Caenorhabditis briggsae]|uniref:Protein CBG27880 n=1 Tax=Caenorhabditis briggsae TaxID=6238 RepID=B6IEH5_CAEBR|nr:Protein CBG27880 [Caenorhabditis briggsae]CAR98305.1 Protein CBG27880 [Caenorhabditis briggsae]
MEESPTFLRMRMLRKKMGGRELIESLKEALV